MYYSIGTKAYWLEESGTGPPLLLLHGFTGSTKTWERFVVRLQPFFRVFTIDLPGHGRTNITEPVTMEEFCEDLALLLKWLSIKKVHLVGYSMGGRTALTFAMIYPDLVASLILESASPGLVSPHEQLSRQLKDESLAKSLERNGVASFIDMWEQLPLFDTQKLLPDQTRKQIRQERLGQTTEGLAASLRSMGTGVQPSWWERLPELTIDILLLAGRLDQKFVTIAEEMDETMKFSKLHLVEAAGHAIHVEQPEIFDKIVKEFLIKSEEKNKKIKWRN